MADQLNPTTPFFFAFWHIFHEEESDKNTHTHAFYSDSIVIRILYYTQFVYLYTSIHMCVSHTHMIMYLLYFAG